MHQRFKIFYYFKKNLLEYKTQFKKNNISQFLFSDLIIKLLIINAFVATSILVFFNYYFEFILFNVSNIQPQLINNLEKQRIWINGFIIVTFLTSSFLIFIKGQKVNKNISQSLSDIKSKINLLFQERDFIYSSESNVLVEIDEINYSLYNLCSYLENRNKYELDLLNRLSLSSGHKQSETTFLELLELKSKPYIKIKDINQKRNTHKKTRAA